MPIHAPTPIWTAGGPWRRHAADSDYQQQLLQSPSPMTGPTHSATQGRLARGTHRCRMLLAARLGAGAVPGGGRGQDVAAGGNSSSSSRGSGGQSAFKHPSQPQPARSLPPYDKQPCRQCTQMTGDVTMHVCIHLLMHSPQSPNRIQETQAGSVITSTSRPGTGPAAI